MPVAFADVATALQHPLVLVGFALFLVAGLFHTALKSDRLPVLDRATAGRLVLRLPLYLFVLALVAVVAGFALAFWQTARTTLDPAAVVASIERQAEARGRAEGELAARGETWQRERAALTGQIEALTDANAALQQTVAALAARAGEADAPPGLADALERIGAGGDPDELTALLVDVAERAEADVAAARSDALRAWREAATVAWWTDTSKALAASTAAPPRASRSISP